MGLDDVLDKVEIVENIDAEGTFLLGRHRGEYFQINICPEDPSEPIEEKVFYKIFRENVVYSEVLQDHVNAQVIIFLSETVPDRFREAIIAHEIGESLLDRRSANRTVAHNYGIECERTYAQKFFDELTRTEFLKWTQENAVR